MANQKLVHQLPVVQKNQLNPYEMSSIDVLSNFQEIKVESPVDKIIRQIRELITSGQLSPGDRLPPERRLAERLGVSRGNVRDAIKKLEFYGILKTLPQSGTMVAGIGITALEGLISDVLKIEDTDFADLIETRILLETESVRLAAERRTEQDIESIQAALQAYEAKVKRNEQAVEEDLMFHLKIAEAGKNTVLKSLMLIIVPDIIRNFIQLDVCESDRSFDALREHKIILQSIIEQNPKAAADAMRVHLKDVSDYSKQLRKIKIL